MKRATKSAAGLAVLVAFIRPGHAAEWYAAPHGRPDAQGTRRAPWDLPSALKGRQRIGPGDVLWLLGALL